MNKPITGIRDPHLNSILQNLQYNIKRMDVRSSIPTTTNLGKGQFCVYSSGNTQRLYVNIDGSIKYLALEDSDEFTTIQSAIDGLPT